MHSNLVPPRTSDNQVDLIGLVFERALAVPHEVKEAFPQGCKNGTVTAILEIAKDMNPTKDPAYTAWLLYRWTEGKLTLADMKLCGETLSQYAEHVAALPHEARNVFGMHTLEQMKAVLALSVDVAPKQTVRIFGAPQMASV